jgi:SAM-dependent methyltransferase
MEPLSVELQRLRTRTYRILRRLAYLPGDTWDSLVAHRGELRPPRAKTFIYGYDPEFQVIGQEFLRHFIELAGLQPHERVLDIGCGIGRVALPLTQWLADGGDYAGFDIVPEGVRWCQTHITPRYPNFRFELADIYNATYNPGGRYRAHDYRFPYADNTFDFAWTKSVYTHMLDEDIAHYLAETARVLKPGGRCLNTFFLLNAESLQGIEAGRSQFDFRHRVGHALMVSEAEPEKAIAFDEPWIYALHAHAGLEIVEPLHYGAWSGRTPYVSGQDMVLAVKRA